MLRQSGKVKKMTNLTQAIKELREYIPGKDAEIKIQINPDRLFDAAVYVRLYTHDKNGYRRGVTKAFYKEEIDLASEKGADILRGGLENMIKMVEEYSKPAERGKFE